MIAISSYSIARSIGLIRYRGNTNLDPCSCQKVELTGSKDGTFDGVWTKEAEDYGGKAAYAKVDGFKDKDTHKKL